MLPLRKRIWPVLGLAFGAPICAEFLQAYLPSTGDAPMLLLSLFILAPLYGGAALLIREVSVRRGLGWTGTLLLGAAFGLAMPGLVDLSLFTEDRADIAYWAEQRRATLVPGLGVAAFPAISWVAGHILMSVGAPLAVLDCLAPAHRDRRLLGRVGIVVTAVPAIGVALLIRSDAVHLTGEPGAARTSIVAVAVLALVALALTPVGRRVVPGRARPAPAWTIALAGLVIMMSIDLLPATWIGVVMLSGLLIAAAAGLRWYSAATAWSPRQVAALAAGALTGRTLIGLLAPVPDGVSAGAKLGQNLVLLAAVLGVAWLLVRDRWSESTSAG
ncbi:hypothetical protein [Actinoplanes sp. NPDC026619]|uniref:hypothetical protein n=1 Tax=Actinoplanes sp. NPDC026619 TaxID=3155798 RepID=UPI003406C6B8